jgi:hypothetical protein
VFECTLLKLVQINSKDVRVLITIVCNRVVVRNTSEVYNGNDCCNANRNTTVKQYGAL